MQADDPHRRAETERAAGRLDAAVALYRTALAAAPGRAETLAGLFAALDALARAGTPEEAVARSNRAEGLRRQGRQVEAEAEHRAALAWLPDFGGIHFNLGVVLQDLNRLEEAVRHFAEAGRLMPRFAAAPASLGLCLLAQGCTGAAEEALRRALALDPALLPARLGLGSALRDIGALAEAIRHYAAAALLAPDRAEPAANLGLTLKEQGDLPAALRWLERALLLGLPDAGGVLAQAVQQRRHLCRWDSLPERSAALSALVREGRTTQAPPWILLGEGLGPALERAAAERYTAWRCRGLVPLPALARCDAGDGRPVRVGYLSADFHEHATAVLIAETIERHDRTRIAVHAFSYGPDDGGPLRARLRAAFDGFTDLRGLGHAEAAAAIRRAGVDILVDLKGHTQGARPEIPALRPAPVQATWLGYPGTSGAPFFDYVLVDLVVAPPDHQPYYTESLVLLPGCYQPNDRSRVIGLLPERAACGLPVDATVLCCFNSAYKIGPEVFDLWMDLLREMPAAVLWLLESHPEVTGNLRRAAAVRGVAPDRLVFAPRRPLPDYLAQYGLADLFLDTWPVGAHTTASDALWAGLPVLTWLGPSFAGRVAASLLHAVGLPELVADSPADYAATARRLLGRPAELADLRARVTAARDSAPLFDTERFCRGLEDAYRAIWQRHCAGLPPATLVLPT